MANSRTLITIGTAATFAAAVSASLVINVAAAKPDPSGTFSLSDGPYYGGGSVTYYPGPVKNVTNSYEVTIGTWCVLADGTQLRWNDYGIGSGNNPYINEFNSFDGWPDGFALTLPLPATGQEMNCIAREIAAWWKPNIRDHPVEAWTLDEHSFEVLV